MSVGSNPTCTTCPAANWISDRRQQHRDESMEITIGDVPIDLYHVFGLFGIMLICFMLGWAAHRDFSDTK